MRRKAIIVLITILIAGSTVPIISADITWSTETVDSTGNVGRHTSIAIDSSNNPHISYYDETNDDLKYAYYDGSWHTETVDSTGDVGEYTSIALDSSNNPHISYHDIMNADLEYAYHDGSSWYIETVDYFHDVGFINSIALDSSNNPHISYFDYTNYDLKYAYDGNGDRDFSDEGEIQTVDSTGDVGDYTSLALDSSNNPHISYYDATNDDLKYAYYDGSWHTETVDSTGNVGQYTSIALDSSNNPHISYFDYTNYDLKYVYDSDGDGDLTDETSQTVDSTGNVGWFTSLALDSSNNPHISYYDAWSDALKYVYDSDGDGDLTDETSQTVDSTDNVGYFTSLALDAFGYVHISYYDDTNEDLKYAKSDQAPSPPVPEAATIVLIGFGLLALISCVIYTKKK